MHKMQAVKRFFSAPVFDDNPEKSSKASLISGILNVSLGALLIIFIGTVWRNEVHLSLSVTDAFGLLIGLILRLGLHRGYVNLVSILFLGSVFVLCTLGNVLWGTVYTPTTSVYMLLVAIGGILFGCRGSLSMIVLSSMAVFGLILAENTGILSGQYMVTGLTPWLSYTLFFSMAGAMTTIGLRIIRQALNSAEQELVLRRETEAVLKERETFLRLITDNIQEMVALVEPDGIVQYASQACETCLGYSPQEMIGRSGFEMMHPDDSPQIQAHLQKAFQSGKSDKLFTFRSRHADGHYIWLEASGQLIWEQDEIKGIVTVFRDVTSQREAEEQIRILSRAVESSPIAILMTDANHNITYVNPKFSEMTHYQQGEVSGHNPRILQSGQTALTIYQDLWHSLTTGQEWSGELLNKRKDGRFYWEASNISSIRDTDGKITHFVCFKEDITVRKQMETAQLEANSMLKAQNEDLDAYAHTVAHDIKSPIGIMVGFAEFLAAYYNELPAEQIQEALYTMISSGHKVSQIIESLLLLASVNRQDVLAEPLVMSSIVTELLQSLEKSIEKEAACIEVIDLEKWPLVLGYAPWVETVWMNYLSNALKYGGQPPHIVLSATPQEDNFVRFSIRDNGRGLTAVEQERLFTQFERLDRVAIQGHGLGLSIVRRIMDKLGGQVGVESKVDEGSVFYFTLPAVPSSL